jgi:hypothetical protein
MKKVLITNPSRRKQKVHIESPLEDVVTLCGELYNKWDPNFTRLGEEISGPVIGETWKVDCKKCLAIVAYCQQSDSTDSWPSLVRTMKPVIKDRMERKGIFKGPRLSDFVIPNHMKRTKLTRTRRP